MPFTTLQELKTVSTIKRVNLIVNGDEETVNDIIEENIDLMKSYIFKYYDADAIFNAEDGERSKLVLKHLKSLIIFDLHNIRGKEVTPELEKKYDEAMRWLEKIAKGDIEADLPLKEIDSDGDGQNDSSSNYLKLGSRKNYPNRW